MCTTELGTVQKYLPRFTERNTKVFAVSVDDAESHRGWIKDINEVNGVTVTFPIVADKDHKVSKIFSMIHPAAPDTGAQLTVRSVFIIGPDRKVKLTLTYPASTGRNFDEIVRVLDSLQLTAFNSVATPANWVQGQDCVIVPSIPTSECAAKFPKGFREVKPYLRFTPQPDKKI